MTIINDILLLIEEDLIKESRTKDIKDILSTDVKDYKDSFYKASYVFFKNQSGQLKILKNRYPIF